MYETKLLKKIATVSPEDAGLDCLGMLIDDSGARNSSNHVDKPRNLTRAASCQREMADPSTKARIEALMFGEVTESDSERTISPPQPRDDGARE